MLYIITIHANLGVTITENQSNYACVYNGGN